MNRESKELFTPEVINNQKPTVIYLQGERDGDSHPYEEAKIAYLKNDLKCQVLQATEYDVYEKRKELLFLIKTGSVVSFLVEEGRYDEYDPNYPKDIFNSIRNCSPTVPIIFSPRWGETSKYDFLSEEPNVVIVSERDKVFKLIKKQVKKFKRTPNYFGVENIDQLEPMSRRILQSYENSDHDHGAAPSNDQTIIQAINIRINPSDLSISIKPIFDDNLKPDLSLDFIEGNADKETLEAEKQRIKNYSQEEREQLVKLVYDSKNFDRDGNRQRFVVGMGDDTTGFAIDPETMEYQTTGYGGHKLMKKFLAGRISDLDSFRKTKDVYNEEREDEIMRRFVSGFIFPRVKGFSFPILITDYFDFEKDRYRKAVEFLNKQNFIVITKGGRLIE